MAFKATQALRMVVTKTSTGLVGLAVDVNARANYIAMTKKILKSVKKIPERAQYRKDVEAIFGHHLRICQENEDEATIEKKIALGQLEELLQDGKDELKVIAKYYDAKMWEVVERMNEGADSTLDDYLDPINPIPEGKEKPDERKPGNSPSQ